MPPRPPPRQSRSGGVALGVLGLMLMAFFTIVLLLGRPAYHRVYDEIVHPFDPHPAGVKREAVVTDKTTVDAKAKPELLKEAAAAAAATAAAKAAKTEFDAVMGTKKTSQAQAAEKVKADAAAAEKAKADAAAAEKAKADAAVAEKAKADAAAAEKIKTDAAAAEKAKADAAAAEKAKADAAAVAVKPQSTAVAKEDGVTALDEKYTPTKEMVSKISQEGYLMVTWANFHYYDFVRSWISHVKEIGVTGYIVGAMDDRLLEKLIADHLNCFSMRSGLTHGDFGWGSATFAKMGREKIRLVALFLKLDVHVIISDVDVIWLRNPIPYFQQYPKADILTSSDHLSHSVNDESLEIWPQAASAANIGIMLFRAKSLEFVEKWIEIIVKDDKIWDQNAFNDMFRRGVKEIPGDKQHLFLAYEGTLTMGILPVSIFCSGHTYFVQRMADKLGLKAYAVHATFQFSGTPGKRHRMREMMIWEDLPEYYNHPVGFLSFAMDGIDELLKTAGPSTGQMDLANVQGHFKLVNHQFLRVRSALVIAGLLNRSLVMPELWAGQDRWWAPHSGRIPGSHPDLPLKVPMDHFFDLEGAWTKRFDENEMGPNVDFKEYSFLNNTRIPAEVRNSKLLVDVCDVGAAACSDGSSPAPVETIQGVARIRVQAGLKSEQLKVALRNAEHFKVMHFSTMANAFGGYTNPQDWDRLLRRLRLYGSIWCCINAHPGHVHYDLLWDVPGHVDKFNKKWPGIWEVTTGP